MCEMPPFQRHFERDAIPYTLDLDWPVGAAGFEPVYQNQSPHCFCEMVAHLKVQGTRPDSVCVRD